MVKRKGRRSKEEKAETRRRILAAAAVQLREKGCDGISIPHMMQSIGLTHGGFYAHFNSRDALVREALDYAMNEANRRWGRLRDRAPDEGRLAAVVSGYLSGKHRDNPGHGCALPIFAAFVEKADRTVKEVYVTKLEGMASVIADASESRAEALATIATMVGALVLARATASEPISDEILGAAQASILKVAKR